MASSKGASYAGGAPNYRQRCEDVAAAVKKLGLEIDETERRTWFLFEASRQEGSNAA